MPRLVRGMVISVKRMVEYWNQNKSFFYDCRLEAYYSVLRFLGKDISEAEFFISSQLMQEKCALINTNIKKHSVYFPIICNCKRAIEEKLCEFWSVNRESKTFDTIEEEIEFIKENIERNNPVLVEVNTKVIKNDPNVEKLGYFGSVSTVAIVDFEENNNQFVLGMKHFINNELIRIDMQQYERGRKEKNFPFMVDRRLYTLSVEAKDNRKINRDEGRRLFMEQIHLLSEQNGFIDLAEMIEKHILSNHKLLLRMHYDMLILAQLQVLSGSVCLGSFSGYYYELAKYAVMLGIINEKEYKDYLKIGHQYKKVIASIDKAILDIKDKELIRNIVYEINRFTEIKRQILSDKIDYDYIDKEETNYETAIS